MPLRCILVPIGPGIDARHRLDAALRICRYTHAHIDALYIEPDPESTLRNMPDVVLASGITAESIQQDAREAAGKAQAQFDEWCVRNDVPSGSDHRLDRTFASWRRKVGDLEATVALSGRVSDLIVIDKPALATPFHAVAFDAAVFSSGRPVLVIPREGYVDPLGHVAIAWNGSLEGARAVGQSIALLHEAERVSVITVPSERSGEAAGADLCQYLQWHGIVTGPPITASAGSGSAGEAILATCGQLHATMLVMGAYTHSRMRELFLGGVTKHVLAHGTLPVLMAH
ncbi:universal stress protein [Labrys monachus]|uniref:Nucleotide-binding universal stress UspA family protein n=1 Tax=Labrys monachus TaxID=217067 RepID=A0ABU0FAF5_9HYPH|nr:universal stress protein [Labrys monachus]MDQ0391094.1 nucleotide-binding universal stress UspA family protein [Labrys monachus]